MYSTCLFCNGDLGANEVIERFPVGRRLAFDAAKGRLWVVCTRCRRWNLTPLEERWEAIEEAERRFRNTRLRVSTGEIGLARLREGLELVRVGAPQRPEIAAWRYGEQFGARRRRQLLAGGALATAGGLAIVGGLYVGASMLFAYSAGRALWRGIEHGFPHTRIARVRQTEASKHWVTIRRADLASSTLQPGADGGLAMLLRHESGETFVEGERARQVARQIFPGINRRGGHQEDVARAVAHLEHAGEAERFLARTAARGERLTRTFAPEVIGEAADPGLARNGSGLLALSTSLGLAIEMALNEEQERRALEGELAELEEAWREAEEIGAIADSLLLPPIVEQALGRLRGRGGDVTSATSRE